MLSSFVPEMMVFVLQVVTCAMYVLVISVVDNNNCNPLAAFLMDYVLMYTSTRAMHTTENFTVSAFPFLVFDQRSNSYSATGGLARR